jgi:hypothetical protein
MKDVVVIDVLVVEDTVDDDYWVMKMPSSESKKLSSMLIRRHCQENNCNCRARLLLLLLLHWCSCCLLDIVAVEIDEPSQLVQQSMSETMTMTTPSSARHCTCYRSCRYLQQSAPCAALLPRHRHCHSLQVTTMTTRCRSLLAVSSSLNLSL